PASGDFEATQIADMNNDGHGDLIAFVRGRIVLYTGDGAGNWEHAAEVETPGTRGLAAFRAGVDLDHNGFPDIGVVASEGPSPFSARNHPRIFLEGSVPAELRVFAKYPSGGETFVAGSVRFIEWNAAVPRELGSSTVTLELSLEGPDGPWQMLAAALPNNRRYQWRVPPDLPASSDCYVPHSLEAGKAIEQAVSRRAFRIVRLTRARD